MAKILPNANIVKTNSNKNVIKQENKPIDNVKSATKIYDVRSIEIEDIEVPL